MLKDLFCLPNNNPQQCYKYWFHKLSSLGPIVIVLEDIQDKVQFINLIINTSFLVPKSYIIVTSHDWHLLKLISGKSNLYLYGVGALQCEDSQKLFNWHAFGNEKAPQKLKTLANDVNKACSGLPLALKVLGSSLFNKTSNEDQKYI